MSLGLKVESVVPQRYMVFCTESGVALGRGSTPELAWKEAALVLDEVLHRVHKSTDIGSDEFLGAQL